MESCWWQGLLDTALCDKASTTNTTDHHYINEIVLKVALSTITITLLTLRLLVASLACSSFVLTIHNRYFYFILTIQYFVVYRATRTLQIRGELSCFGRVSSSCSTSGTRRATILWHRYFVLLYDTCIVYYITTPVFCTILWHRNVVLYYDTVIMYYIMTQALCTISYHRYFGLYYDTDIS